MLAIIDYDAGNLRSVIRAVEHADGASTVTADPARVRAASAVILPGVGSARQAMNRLHELGMDDALRDVAARGVPLFGVCLGQQLLLAHSDEGGPEGTRCLGLLPGAARLFPAGLKVPHMGWNTVAWQGACALATGIASDSYFYFVHSYYTELNPASSGGATEYGVKFASALQHENIMATQFHPEKSGPDGLRVYRNFLRLAGQCI